MRTITDGSWGRLDIVFEQMKLTGDRVVLRSPEPPDADVLFAILRQPEIERRWGRFDIDAVQRDLVEDGAVFVIEADDQIVGAIQYGEENDQMYRHASIDLFVTTARWGTSIGSDAIRTLTRYLFEDRGHHRLTIDPALDNDRAIRVYERLGFRAVGVLHQYERGLDGTFHDGLLMELLRDDLAKD